MSDTKWLRANTSARQLGVDRENAVIRGVILAEEGPFKSEGRGEFDGKSLKQIVSLSKDHPAGLRSRFTHPDLSSDGLGKYLGRTKNIHRATIERGGKVSQVVRGDHFFAKSAFNTPSGDLATYIMDLAEEDPEALGMSLVLSSEEEFRTKPDGSPKVDENGNELPPLWRPTSLRAVDFVDSGDATNSLLTQSLSIDGLPDRVVREAAQLLKSQFAGKPREFVEPRLNAWVQRVLAHYWPGELEPTDVDVEDLRRQLKQRRRRNSLTRIG